MTDVETQEHEQTQQIMDRREEAAILRDVAFGFDVQAFLRSDIGRYLVARGESERLDALEALASVDPENSKAIRDLQFQIAVVDRWQYWLGEAVTTGETAQKQFIEQGA